MLNFSTLPTPIPSISAVVFKGELMQFGGYETTHGYMNDERRCRVAEAAPDGSQLLRNAAG